jgi:hypothetical protein
MRSVAIPRAYKTSERRFTSRPLITMKAKIPPIVRPESLAEPASFKRVSLQTDGTTRPVPENNYVKQSACLVRGTDRTVNYLKVYVTHSKTWSLQLRLHSQFAS